MVGDSLSSCSASPVEVLRADHPAGIDCMDFRIRLYGVYVCKWAVCFKGLSIDGGHQGGIVLLVVVRRVCSSIEYVLLFKPALEEEGTHTFHISW